MENLWNLFRPSSKIASQRDGTSARLIAACEQAVQHRLGFLQERLGAALGGDRDGGAQRGKDDGAVLLARSRRHHGLSEQRLGLEAGKALLARFQKFSSAGSGGKPDTCCEIDDFLTNGVHSATPRNFAEFVEGGTPIEFQPDGLVFGEAPSTLVGPDGKVITGF